MAGERNGSRWVLLYTVQHVTLPLIRQPFAAVTTPWMRQQHACFITVIKDKTAECPTLESEVVLSQLHNNFCTSWKHRADFFGLYKYRRNPPAPPVEVSGTATNTMSGVSESCDIMLCVNYFSHFDTRCQTLWALASPVAHTHFQRTEGKFL